jgi:hypothetical protein
VAKRFVHKQLLSAHPDVPYVELVPGQRFSVLCCCNHPTNHLDEVSKLLHGWSNLRQTCWLRRALKLHLISYKIDVHFITFRYFKLSAALSTLLLLSSLATTIYVSLHFKYIHKVSEPFESFDILYDKPWQRYGPYAMGNYDLSATSSWDYKFSSRFLQECSAVTYYTASKLHQEFRLS